MRRFNPSFRHGTFPPAPFPGGPARAGARPGAPDELNVALLIPRSGPAGMFGPSCELSARLAAEELNKANGAAGREVRLIPVDGGVPPREIARETDRLISTGAVDAVVGWQISAVRQALTPAIRCRVPYVYTAQYEGGERSPGVFLLGETPAGQLLPAMRLLGEERGIRRWCVVGNDYVWPRVTAGAARRYARQCGAKIAAELFVPLGTTDFSASFAGSSAALPTLCSSARRQRRGSVQPRVRRRWPGRPRATPVHPDGREHAARLRPRCHQGPVGRVRLLRNPGHRRRPSPSVPATRAASASTRPRLEARASPATRASACWPPSARDSPTSRAPAARSASRATMWTSLST